MTELMLDDPLRGLEHAKPGLEDALALAPLLPVEVTTSHPAASATVNAWGILRGVEVRDPVATRSQLTAVAFNAAAVGDPTLGYFADVQDEKPRWTKDRWDPTYGHRLNNTQESVKRHRETHPPH